MFFNNRKQGHNFYENMANKHERFGIRRLTIGAVSVLLGGHFLAVEHAGAGGRVAS